jgi:hypothetical protein
MCPKVDPDDPDGFSELIGDLGAKARELMYRYHYELTNKFGPIERQLSMYDIFMAGVLRRSYALTRGFFDLIASRNFTAAAALVRLQVDNALRTAASAWTRDPEEFFHLLLEGKQINKMLADDGKRMTDRYLCDRLALEHPWISQLYLETSAFIHLSDKHFFAAIAAGGDTITSTVLSPMMSPAFRMARMAPPSLRLCASLFLPCSNLGFTQMKNNGTLSATGSDSSSKHHDSAIDASTTNRFNCGGPDRASRECSRHQD